LHPGRARLFCGRLRAAMSPHVPKAPAVPARYAVRTLAATPILETPIAMHAETLDLIKRSATIPSMPLVATRCYEMTQDPACDYGKLVELLGTDPGMAADVLRLSNSALFGVTRQIGSLRQAMTLLGIKRIRELVLTRYLVQKTEEVATDAVDMTYFWRRSLTTAVLSAKFAGILAPANRDEAFIGGLLADVGVLILAKAIPDRYHPIAEQYRPRTGDEWTHDEYNLLGVTHGEVSALVLEQWRLPQTLVDAVRYHHARHDDLPADSAGAMLARMIGAAGMIARILCEATDTHEAAAACTDVTDRVNLDILVLIRALDGIEEQIEQLAELLQVDVWSSRVFASLGKELIEILEQNVSAAGA